MKIEKSHKRRIGRLSRLAMMFAGRVGIRRTDVDHFKQNMQRILTAWSRLNLEGRSKTWSQEIFWRQFLSRERWSTATSNGGLLNQKLCGRLLYGGGKTRIH